MLIKIINEKLNESMKRTWEMNEKLDLDSEKEPNRNVGNIKDNKPNNQLYGEFHQNR